MVDALMRLIVKYFQSVPYLRDMPIKVSQLNQHVKPFGGLAFVSAYTKKFSLTFPSFHNILDVFDPILSHRLLNESFLCKYIWSHYVVIY